MPLLVVHVFLLLFYSLVQICSVLCAVITIKLLMWKSLNLKSCACINFALSEVFSSLCFECTKCWNKQMESLFQIQEWLVRCMCTEGWETAKRRHGGGGGKTLKGSCPKVNPIRLTSWPMWLVQRSRWLISSAHRLCCNKQEIQNEWASYICICAWKLN